MRILRALILVTFVLVVAFFLVEEDTSNKQFASSREAVEKSYMLEEKSPPNRIDEIDMLDGELYHWIGKSEEDLLKKFGQPNRKDLSAYEYVWWVYPVQHHRYLQFGIGNGVVKTIYAIGDELSIAPIQIGDSHEEVREHFTFEEEVFYSDGVGSFTFRMTPKDLLRRPLVKLSDEVFAQLYFDTINNQLSSIRLMNPEVLLRHQPYEIVYRGTLPEKPELDDSDWQKIESGMEQQIFDISNVIRNRFGKRELLWEEEISEVAYLHSKDMHDNDYFSHYSLSGDGLKERLEATEVFYISAGENIAAQYPDAPAATEGWLNSQSHRDALLLDDYTHLGVGVHRLYYTQNFLAKPM